MSTIKINYNGDNHGAPGLALELNISDMTFFDEVKNSDVIRYLKGIFTNKERFKTRFVDVFKSVRHRKSFFPEFFEQETFFKYLTEDFSDNSSNYFYPYVKWIDKSFWSDEKVEEEHRKLNEQYFKDIKTVGVATDEEIEDYKNRCNGTPIKFIPNDTSIFNCDEFMDKLLDAYDRVEPFTYAEAFKLENQQFQALVFGSIDIVDMIKELGHERIATEGKRVSHKDFSHSGEFLGMKEYDVIYETHKVDISSLGEVDVAYALRCWCTTTDKEHWLWIEDQYAKNPLEAVASTMRVHKNLIDGNHIKEIKRQGDVLLVEVDSDVTPEGELVPLTAEQYFGFLTAQS